MNIRQRPVWRRVRWLATSRHNLANIWLEDGSMHVVPVMRYSWGTAVMLSFPELYGHYLSVTTRSENCGCRLRQEQVIAARPGCRTHGLRTKLCEEGYVSPPKKAPVKGA